MIERILLAVDDSPDSLAAARTAIGLAAALGAPLLVVHVRRNHTFDAALAAAAARPETTARRERSEEAILARIASLAREAEVHVQTRMLDGHVGAQVLDVARSWAADVVVLGRSARARGHEPYVGPHTRHILEFAEQAVLVVPGPPEPPRWRAPGGR